MNRDRGHDDVATAPGQHARQPGHRDWYLALPSLVAGGAVAAAGLYLLNVAGVPTLFIVLTAGFLMNRMLLETLGALLWQAADSRTGAGVAAGTTLLVVAGIGVIGLTVFGTA